MVLNCHSFCLLLQIIDKSNSSNTTSANEVANKWNFHGNRLALANLIRKKSEHLFASIPTSVFAMASLRKYSYLCIVDFYFRDNARCTFDVIRSQCGSFVMSHACSEFNCTYEIFAYYKYRLSKLLVSFLWISGSLF